MTLTEIKKQISTILYRYPIAKAALFGSFAEGNGGKNSDIDILIETSKPVSLFTILQMEKELKKTTRRKIDIVEYSAIKPSIRKFVLRYTVPLI